MKISMNPERQAAERLAELLADERGALVLAQAQKVAIHGRAASSPVHRRRAAAPPQEVQSAGRVGIWVEESDRPVLRRDPALAEQWRCWADRDEIPLRTGLRRVVLLGESMARGYFLDPLVTPSMLLEQWMAGSAEGAEVIDLAKVGLQIDELTTLTKQALSLSPDVLVVVAGNNWTNPQLTVAHLERLSQGLRSGGWVGMRAVFWEAVVLPRVRRYLRELEAIATQSGVPVILAIPPYNLGSWAPEQAVTIPALPKADQWFRLRDEVMSAAGKGENVRVIELTEALEEIDQGLSPLTPWLQAQSLERMGDLGAAREQYARARDAACGLLLAHTPRCPGPVIDAMRDACRRGVIQVVDLVTVFGEVAERPGIPGRDLFLDYCHLSPRGHVVMVRELAAAVAKVFGEDGPATDPQIDLGNALDRARAHVLAALHSSHYGQNWDELRHHVQTAVAESVDVLPMFSEFVDFHGRMAPAWMCSSYQRFCAAPAVGRYLAATVPRQVDKLRDRELRGVMLEALEAADPELAAMAAEVILNEYAGEETDLLAYRWRCRTFRERSGFSRAATRAVVESHEVISSFDFAATGKDAHQLRMCFRTPHAVEGDVGVSVNGLPIAADVQASQDWSEVVVDVPADRTLRGVNDLTLSWPYPKPQADSVIASDCRRLELGEGPRVLVVCAELAQLEITSVRVTGEV